MCEYSIWLTLEESSSAHAQLKRVIDTLAHTYDDAPAFEPHLTLVGGIDGDRQRLAHTVSALGEETEPSELDISGVQCSTTAHQCVFCLVEPSLQLLQLRRQAMTTLERPEAMYVPHLSLIYSDMGLDQRVALADAIDPAALPNQVRVTTIEVVETSGPVTDWESVCTVPL
ncbi:2'-5' RNA ligase family protein [Halorubrum sp. FL23]|uniref:2'-5' RNA ligase family protein n=1 Tax=Halorubrum sp. FL23 TaxID=3458704 RepID=UPI004034F6B9